MNDVFASVFFDWDSTLSRIEGIDELARDAPEEQRREIERATADAMAGRCTLEEVYRRRLEVVAPGEAELRSLAARYHEELVPDAAEVVAALRTLGKVVGVISGGLLPAVVETAAAIGIQREHVHAVPVRIDAAGRFDGFDERFPLACTGGKQVVLAGLPPSCRPLCFVGDGMTDLEAAGEVDRFVGFGGVVRRPEVERAAAHYCHEPRLAPLLRFLLSDQERRQLGEDPRFAALQDR